ncbi:MAG: 50S ribosomal protein L11 methyltransferase [Deltaproteobacteria bacterium]|nr:50S ribosomal protein L11 methyltransferase [Deltaproteobacteria bacterium]MCB9788072.1 50S ribosomal protein L11 methyltransferase [Deltaproteobacteria bacterium]
MSTRWTELTLLVPIPPAIDAAGEQGVEAFLAPLDAACLELSPQGYVTEGPDAPPGDVEPPPAGTRRLKVYVAEELREQALARAEAAAAAFEGAVVEAAPLDPAWRERWKRWFTGFDVSARLRVRPPWEAAVDGQGVTVIIEPGMAFGTGQHETTRLCLEAMDAALTDGAGAVAVLDVGTGTGILAIAAALLGAGRVVAIDNDRDAVAIAAENARANGVGGRVEASSDALSRVRGEFDLVVANILAPVLMGMAPELVRHTAPGGLLVLSGILAGQADGVADVFAGAGMALSARAREGEWVRLDLRRADGGA